MRYSLENPHAYVDSNLVGFTNILEGCRQTGVPATSANTDELAAWVGFKPCTPVREGVRRFVEWYREFYGD